MVAVPFCRCRVLYIGSAVPTITKDGLQGIQQPLKERYPTDETTDTKGIDSWLSVWSNGILLEYIDGDKKTETAFYQISSLHYCAAVRYVNVTGYAVEGGGEKFLPLDSPFANNEDSRHPPIFAAIFRRTTGIKVLECHAFICTNSKAANALVRCCFHAYAESMYIKLDERIPGLKAIKEASRSGSPHSERPPSVADELSGEEEKEQRWAERAIGKETWERRQQSGEYDSASISSSIANRFSTKRNERTRVTAENSALIPFNNGEGYQSRRAGSDIDVAYGDQPFPGYHPGMPPPFPRGCPIPPMGPMMGPHPMMRPPFFPPCPPFPPHMMPHHPPPMFSPHMMHPPFGMPMRFPQRMFGPPPVGMMYPRFIAPYMPPPQSPGRPRTPTEGPIITGPESVYGTLPRRPAFEEPIYMPGNTPYSTPQASYQPANYPSDHYDAYYDSYKRHRSPQSVKEKSTGSHTSSKKGANIELEEPSAFWDTYESNIYRKPHINEKAFSATARSMPTTVNESTMVTEADIRPETPPADYDSAFEGMHISKQAQQRTAAVMY